MFGLVTRKTYEQDLLQMESENICLSKQNEGLQDRIRLGEEYRDRLSFENTSIKQANRELLMRIDELENKIQDMGSNMAHIEYQLKEERLLRMSLETSWGKTNE